MADEKVAELVSKYFVPFASDATSIRDNQQKWGWEVEVTAAWGFHVVSPDGKKVANATSYGTSGAEPKVETIETLVQFLENVLQKVGKPAPRKAPPARGTDRGLGLQSDGSARLAVYVRESGTYGLPMFDSIYLGADHLKALAPPQAKARAQYAIPEGTARELSAVLTLDSCSSCKIYPDNVTRARLEAEVTAVTGERVEVRLKGDLAGKGKQTAVTGESKLEGLLTFDGKGRLQSLLFVCEGTYQGGWIDTFRGGKGTPIQGVIEWRAAAAGAKEK